MAGSFKEIWGFRNLRLCTSSISWVFAALMVLVGQAQAETCLAPTRPFVPADPKDAHQFRNLIRQDFEFYIQDIQAYFRCLDEERARAFKEAQEVSQDYGRFIQATTE